MEVDVGGAAPALFPIVFDSGLPLHAEVSLEKEVFAT
jgi:hypothetical protein